MNDLFRVPSDLLGHPEISGLCEATEIELFCRLCGSGQNTYHVRENLTLFLD